MRADRGFSLIELLVVISIIALLLAIILPRFKSIRDDAQAAKVVSELRSIEGQLNLFMAEAGRSTFPLESVYNPGGSNYADTCDNEPPLTETDLYEDVSGFTGWNGPYFLRVPETPYRNEYRYDNDNDTYTGSGVSQGVNIVLQWCNTDARVTMLQVIDEMLDGSVSSTTGSFRYSYTSGGGGAHYLIDPN